MYAEVTDDTDINAEIATATADVTAAVLRLAMLSRGDKPSMIATLEALTAISGPLYELVEDLLGDGAAYLEYDGHGDAAERMGYAATGVSVASDCLADALDCLRKN
jgi:hypothetical protein